VLERLGKLPQEAVDSHSIIHMYFHSLPANSTGYKPGATLVAFKTPISRGLSVLLQDINIVRSSIRLERLMFDMSKLPYNKLMPSPKQLLQISINSLTGFLGKPLDL
jgi:hypothetical protein